VASTVYELFFGTANAGGAPAWARFARGDTHAAIVAPPAFTEIGNGLYSFAWDWGSSPSASIEYVATLAGVELSDVISANASPGTVTVSASSSQNLALYPSAKTVLNRAAEQCTQEAQADPFQSTNPDFVLLRNLLISLSRDLMRNEWTHLVKTVTLVTDGVTLSYSLPSDFRGMVDNSMWNRSTRLPGIGPLSFQQRAALQARLVQIVLNVAFQVQGGLLTFPIVPPSGQTVAFDYRSLSWVQSATSSTPDKDRPTASTDTLLFDEELLVAGLVLRFNENRGYDTVRAQARFDTLLETALGDNAGASIASLGGNPRFPGDRMVGGWNVPEGGWPT
jgi:hypothetical protein